MTPVAAECVARMGVTTPCDLICICTHPRWCALNRGIHSRFSFQTSLTWSGNETIHYATWKTRSAALMAAWVLEDESGERETHAELGGCSESSLSCYGRQPISMPSFAVSPRSVIVVCVGNSVRSSMFMWFHFSPRDFSQLSFSGRPPHTTTNLQFP